jgi:hypothetical protein
LSIETAVEELCVNEEAASGPVIQAWREGGEFKVWEECATRGGESEPVSDGVVPDRGWRNWWILEGSSGADGRVPLLECSSGPRGATGGSRKVRDRQRATGGTNAMETEG